MSGDLLFGFFNIFQEPKQIKTFRKVVSDSKGGIDAIITWTFEPLAGGTKVFFAADYKVPIPLLGKLAEAFIVRLNKHEGEATLANLKSGMEI